MRVVAITGPVLEPDDPVHWKVQIPVKYWKVLVFRHDETKELTATGYLMSQEGVLPTNEEFVYGQFRNSQTTIRHVESLTGLSFHHLSKHDPFDDGSESILTRQLWSVEDIVFRRS